MRLSVRYTVAIPRPGARLRASWKISGGLRGRPARARAVWMALRWAVVRSISLGSPVGDCRGGAPRAAKSAGGLWDFTRQDCNQRVKLAERVGFEPTRRY